MHFQLKVICLLIIEITLVVSQLRRDSTQSAPQYMQLSSEQIRQLRQNFGPTVSPFRPTTEAYEDDSDDTLPSSSQAALSRTPTYDEGSYVSRNALPVVQQRSQILKSQQLQGGRKSPSYPELYRQQLEEDPKQILNSEEKDKEIEEPDRLTLLLPESKFDCTGKKTGYYADDGLGCEVFHYCQNNAKHSWICPEGFTFHQVHLICMPPGQDNICEQSPQFHFINEFLYKPLNLEEHQSKPNISLRYSDRYYPNQYNYQSDYSEEEEVPQQIKHSGRVPVQQPQAPRVIIQRRPSPTPFAATIRPETTLGQVFRSPEEVNISLQQRRPPYVAQRYISNEDY